MADGALARSTVNGWGRPAGASDDFLPYGRQTIEADDIAAVVDALQADLLTTGPMVGGFEAALAEAAGARFAVACVNGTAALHMAVRAAGLKPGEACVVPSVTFLATADAVAFEGAQVVFADVDPATGHMTPQALAEALARAGDVRVRAVLPVHLRGDPVHLPAIGAVAEAAGAVVIEDACHALGTSTPWGLVGAGGPAAMACFSFHAVKTITTAEGGAVTTNDPALAERLRRIRNHGAERDPGRFAGGEAAFTEGEPNPWWYEQIELGWNYRLPDVNCALGLSQLKKLPRFAARRRALFARYCEALADLAPAVRTPRPLEGSQPCWHLMSVQIDFAAAGLSRKAVMDRLRARGIGTQVHYIPVHRQPWWRAKSPELELPGADAYYAGTLSLPLYPAMTDFDVDRVARALAEVLGG